MQLPIYQVDAFADQVFAGNPAAVVPLQQWLSDAVMQGIGAENCLPETAFFVPVGDDPEHDFSLRWFTPTREIELCGHATLASAAVIFDRLGWDSDEIRFHTRQAGTLTVRRVGDMVELNFPARPGQAQSVPDGLSEALGAPVLEFINDSKALAVLENEDQVYALEPDLDYIAQMPCDGLIVTAPGNDSDCASRYFTPLFGIPEDPVTGAAHCTVVPYWAGVLGKTEIHARQVSKRGGELHCRLEGDRVAMAGRAAFYLEGTITV